MLTPQDVRTAYRLILGREPESDAIVGNFVQHASFESLRKTLLGSVEFAERVRGEPDLLGVSPAVLMMSRDLRFCSRRLEHLASIDLPLWGKSVLIDGMSAAYAASFFIDRFCTVSIIEQGDALKILSVATCDPRDKKTAANVSVKDMNLADIVDGEILGRHDIVFADTPDIDSDALRLWLDNVAQACTDFIVVTAKVVPGRAEEVFLSNRVRDRGGPSTVAVPTRSWMAARLKERFAHVYATRTQPNHEGFPLDWSKGWISGGPVQHAIFVASRTPLDAAALADGLPTRQTHLAGCSGARDLVSTDSISGLTSSRSIDPRSPVAHALVETAAS